MKKIVILMFVLLVATFLYFNSAIAGDILNGAGASFPYPVYSAWAYQYNSATGVKLNYQSIGSGGGQRQIISRTVDFGASDAPVKPERLKKEGLLQFPAVIGGVVPVVHINGIESGSLKLESLQVCKIFLGDISYWDDDAIRNINRGLKLPHKKITVVHRSDGSGTTAIFTKYLADTCSSWKSRVGMGKAVKWPVGRGGKGNEGVANYVRRIKNSIGYVEYAYAKQNKLSYIQLKNPAGNFVKPGFKTFQAAAASGAFSTRKHFYLWLTNAPGKNAWPITGATFILMAKEKTESNRGTASFFDWAFKNGDATARRLTYVPLPGSLKTMVRGYWYEHSIH